MVRITDEMRHAISMIEKKGDPVLVIGPTGSGKSVIPEACAKSDIVQMLLEKREASGKGSLTDTNIAITDYDRLDDDCLYYSATLKKLKQSDCNDDNEFLGDILFFAAKEMSKGKGADFTQGIKSGITRAIKNAGNDTLAYKLRNLEEININALAQKLSSEFDAEEVLIAYNEAIAKKESRKARTFTNIITTSTTFQKGINSFWENVLVLLNFDIEALKYKLEKKNAYISRLGNKDEWRFSVIFNEDDLDADSNEEGAQLAEELLRSENGSFEYLLSDINITFKCNDSLMQNGYINSFTVAEINGTPVHCIRLIDTKGLFHSAGADIRDESERIVDLLTKYHSDKIVFVMNACINNTTKNARETLYRTLQEMNHEVDIYVLYTHWDMFMQTIETKNKPKVNKFVGTGKSDINWNDNYSEAYKILLNDVENIKNAIENNTSKRKPRFKVALNAGIITDSSSKIARVLINNDCLYPEALRRLFFNMGNDIAKHGTRFKLKDGFEDSISVNRGAIREKNTTYNITALYENLVNCKNLKLYASTVRACVRKWQYLAIVHDSHVSENDYGFSDIHTTFVQELRNYTMNFVNELSFYSPDYLVGKESAIDFKTALYGYLKENQCLGREVTKAVGEEAYNMGFIADTNFKYQYERFTDMLAYAQKQYFPAKTIKVSDDFLDTFDEALKKCVTDFIKAKCVVVY